MTRAVTSGRPQARPQGNIVDTLGRGIDSCDSTLALRRAGRATAAILVLTAGLALAAASNPAQAALVKYTYTGQNFTEFGLPGGAYTTDMRVEGWFVVDYSQLEPNKLFLNGDLTVIDFLFSDGLNTIVPPGSLAISKLIFDDNLKIIEWEMYADFAGSAIRTALNYGYPFYDVDQGFNGALDWASIHDSPGTWSGPVPETAPVPLPAALPLFAAGLGVLAAFSRCRAAS